MINIDSLVGWLITILIALIAAGPGIVQFFKSTRAQTFEAVSLLSQSLDDALERCIRIEERCNKIESERDIYKAKYNMLKAQLKQHDIEPWKFDRSTGLRYYPEG